VVELTVPDDAERRAVLDADGEPDLIDRVRRSPRRWTCRWPRRAPTLLAPHASAAELLAMYVDRVTGCGRTTKLALNRLHSLEHRHLAQGPALT
jgi:hypothetical protein